LQTFPAIIFQKCGFHDARERYVTSGLRLQSCWYFLQMLLS